jgi:hypothetical protein
MERNERNEKKITECEKESIKAEWEQDKNKKKREKRQSVLS